MLTPPGSGGRCDPGPGRRTGTVNCAGLTIDVPAGGSVAAGDCIPDVSRSVLEPGGCSTFRSHPNSKMLTHPAPPWRRQLRGDLVGQGLQLDRCAGRHTQRRLDLLSAADDGRQWLALPCANVSWRWRRLPRRGGRSCHNRDLLRESRECATVFSLGLLHVKKCGVVFLRELS